MKKRKTLCKQIASLTNAIIINNESGLFQYYNGDFFTLFVTHPANLELHQHLTKAYLDPGQPAHLLYLDEFIF